MRSLLLAGTSGLDSVGRAKEVMIAGMGWWSDMSKGITAGHSNGCLEVAARWRLQRGQCRNWVRWSGAFRATWDSGVGRSWALARSRKENRLALHAFLSCSRRRVRRWPTWRATSPCCRSFFSAARWAFCCCLLITGRRLPITCVGEALGLCFAQNMMRSSFTVNGVCWAGRLRGSSAAAFACVSARALPRERMSVFPVWALTWWNVVGARHSVRLGSRLLEHDTIGRVPCLRRCEVGL